MLQPQPAGVTHSPPGQSRLLSQAQLGHSSEDCESGRLSKGKDIAKAHSKMAKTRTLFMAISFSLIRILRIYE